MEDVLRSIVEDCDAMLKHLPNRHDQKKHGHAAFPVDFLKNFGKRFLKRLSELPEVEKGSYPADGKMHQCQDNALGACSTDEKLYVGYIVWVDEDGADSAVHSWTVKKGKVVEHTPLWFKNQKEWKAANIQYRGVEVPSKIRSQSKYYYEGWFRSGGHEEKHLPGRHNQDTHGRKGIFLSKIRFNTRTSENDIKAWSTQKGIIQTTDDRQFRRLAIKEGNLFLRDSSGVAQAAAAIEVVKLDHESHLPHFESAPIGKYLSIELLAVAPWHSSKSKGRVPGYGTAMMRGIVSKMKDNYEGIFLHSASPNASKFYRAIGMMETKNHVFYWLKKDAISFARNYDQHRSSG